MLVEFTEDGEPYLVNVNDITMVTPSGKGAYIYLRGDSGEGCTTDQSYRQVCLILARAGYLKLASNDDQG